MDITKIGLKLTRKITIKNHKGDYDSTEVQCEAEGTLAPGDNPSMEYIVLGTLIRGHMEKEFQIAASETSSATVDLVKSKEVAMAPPPQAPAPQQFTSKPKPFKCIETGCREMVAIENRRCWPHYQTWNASRNR